MALNPQILTQLEAHGVTMAHWQALLQFVRCQQNGSVTWHWHQGRLQQCELRLVYTGKPAIVSEVQGMMCEPQEGG